MKAGSIRNELESYASTVKEFILLALDGKPKELYQASSHYISSGGKRLRPFMVIKSCEMFGGDLHRALPAAAAVELVHNFSLVHDDIMDNDEVRHSVPTVHKYYGTPLAILAGDILFSKAFQLIVVSGRKAKIPEKAISDIVAKIATACVSVCEGQAIDVDVASSRKLPNESQYVGMICKKTAALFEASCAIGTLSAPQANQVDVENLGLFGRNIGTAFQLVDDLIGVIGDPKLTGKSVGNDIREGKKTYPILLALKNTRSDERDKILKVFGSKSSSSSDLREAVKIISDTGIDSVVRNAAREYMDRALKCIEGYDDSNAKSALQSSAKFIVERSL